MKKPRRSVPPVLVLLLFASHSFGAITLSYEGNSIPDLDGWSDYPGLDPLSTASIHDGVLTFDCPANGDKSGYRRDTLLASDRSFYEWSSRTSNDNGHSFIDIQLRGSSAYSDIMVTWSASKAKVYLLPTNSVFSGTILERAVEPGTFHTYRLESNGALHTFYVDGVPWASETLQSTAGITARVQFGFSKDLRNTSTESDWDYIRIGALPEPSALCLLAAGSLLLRRRLEAR